MSYSLDMLPPHCKDIVVKSLDLKSRMSYRKVNREAKYYVDKAPISVAELKIRNPQLIIKKLEIVTLPEYLIHHRLAYGNEDVYEEETESIIRHERAKKRFMHKLSSAIANLPSQLHVEFLLVKFYDDLDDVLTIIPFLKPTILHSIYLGCKHEGEQLNIRPLFDLPQVQQAKKFTSKFAVDLSANTICELPFEFTYLVHETFERSLILGMKNKLMERNQRANIAFRTYLENQLGKYSKILGPSTESNIFEIELESGGKVNFKVAPPNDASFETRLITPD
ncbi:unnamed protein product [Caenorhabditis sp. 36 PRJEB53466]|nr:unnamed protein product [Caenorhabditis sp. 36 PRJEB53466]